MFENCVHKETFYQPPEDGMPGAWVVFYWEEEANPSCDMHEAKYMTLEKDARDFEGQLIQYDDWATSQEDPLAVQ